MTSVVVVVVVVVVITVLSADTLVANYARAASLSHMVDASTTTAQSPPLVRKVPRIRFSSPLVCIFFHI